MRLGILLALLLLVACSKEALIERAGVNESDVPVISPQTIGPEPSDTPGTTSAEPAAAEFDLRAGNWYIEPNAISVSQGDNVKINLLVESGTHGLGIEGYGVSTGSLGPGESGSVEFVADKKGTFRFYCNVACGAGHRDMQGQLVVE